MLKIGEGCFMFFIYWSYYNDFFDIGKFFVTEILFSIVDYGDNVDDQKEGRIDYGYNGDDYSYIVSG